jgi:hypothetical protein
MIAALVAVALVVPPPPGTDVRRILDAIEAVETGGHRNPDAAVGDGGKARGRLQIHRCAWVDAVDYSPALGKREYLDVHDREYAEAVFVAYVSRYAPDWSIETVAGVWNGGPKGHRKNATKGYRAKARQAWERSDE